MGINSVRHRDGRTVECIIAIRPTGARLVLGRSASARGKYAGDVYARQQHEWSRNYVVNNYRRVFQRKLSTLSIGIGHHLRDVHDESDDFGRQRQPGSFVSVQTKRLKPDED